MKQYGCQRCMGKQEEEKWYPLEKEETWYPLEKEEKYCIEEEEEKMQNFLDRMDENDDVQNVWHNWEE